MHNAQLIPSGVYPHTYLYVHQLGPCALVGLALFVLTFPFQERMMALQHRLRLRSMVWTEQRAKVLLEVLGRSFVVICL